MERGEPKGSLFASCKETACLGGDGEKMRRLCIKCDDRARLCRNLLLYCKGTVRTRFWRHLLRALPFIVFAIRRYCCILFTAKHLKIYSPKVRSNQKLRFCPQTRQGPQAVPSARSRALTQYRGKTRAFDRVPIIPLQYTIRKTKGENRWQVL